MDLGRRPEARFPDSEVTLLDREIDRGDIAYVVEHIGLFGDDNRAGIERTLHRISAIRNRTGKIVGLTCRIGRAVFGTIEIINDFVESGKSILIMGRPGHRQDDDAARGRPRPGRRHGQARRRRRHEQRDRRRRRHPAPGDRQGAPDAGADPVAPARGHDRGGREPHAPGHRHRRDRHRARGPGRADDRRARRPAHRHGARQQPRQPDAQPDPVRPDRRDPERDPRRRGGPPPADPEERAGAQGAADLRRHRRDPGPRAGRGPLPTSRTRSTRCCAAIRSPPSFAGATRRASTDPRAGRARRRASSSARSGSPGWSGSGSPWRMEPGWRGEGSYRGGGSFREAERGGLRTGYRPGASGGWRQTRGGSGRESASRGPVSEGGVSGTMPGERFAASPYGSRGYASSAAPVDVPFVAGEIADRGPLERGAPPSLAEKRARDARELERQKAWRDQAARALNAMKAEDGTGPGQCRRPRG